MADYLYRGFLVDENRHYKLLEEKFIVNFILEGIFVKDGYDGVETFLDSMLKKLVENQDWRKLIDQCSQGKAVMPNRFQLIANFFDEVTNRSLLFHVTQRKKFHIFKFFCDCLEAMVHKTKIREIFYDKVFLVFGYVKSTMDFVVMERCLHYYDDATPSELRDIWSCVIESGIESCRKCVSKEEVQLYLRFVDTHRMKSHQWKDTFVLLCCMTSFFVSHEGCDSDLEKCFKLLSIYELSDDEEEQCALEPYVHQNQMYWVKGKSLNSLLDKLKERGHFKTMKIIAKLVLVVRPDLFEIFYKPKRPQGKGVSKMSVIDIQSLLLPADSLGLTLMHRAAFYGDTEVIKQIFEKFHRNLEGQQMLSNCH